MMPKYHLIYGIIFSLILYLLFPEIGILGFSLIWFGSVFIDLDHPIRYSIKTGNFNPIKFWQWSMERNKEWKKIQNKSQFQKPLFIFHGIEFLIMFYLFSYFIWDSGVYLLIGFLFHLILDYINLAHNHEIIWMKVSSIWVLIYNMNKNKFQ